MNIHRLRLDIEENLRINFLDEIFLRGNFSISDSYFYINTLCVHVSNFYQNFTILITSFVKFTLFTLFLVFTEENIFSIFIFGLIILAIPSRYFTRLNRKFSHISYQSSSEISNNVERVIDNLYLIKILNKFKKEKSLFNESLSDYYYAQFNNQKYGTLNSIFPSFVTMFLLSLLMTYSPINPLITIELIAITPPNALIGSVFLAIKNDLYLLAFEEIPHGLLCFMITHVFLPKSFIQFSAESISSMLLYPRILPWIMQSK